MVNNLFSTLPSELIIKILLYLPIRILKKVFILNKRLSSFSNSNLLWRDLLKRDNYGEYSFSSDNKPIIYIFQSELSNLIDLRHNQKLSNFYDILLKNYYDKKKECIEKTIYKILHDDKRSINKFFLDYVYNCVTDYNKKDNLIYIDMCAITKKKFSQIINYNKNTLLTFHVIKNFHCVIDRILSNKENGKSSPKFNDDLYLKNFINIIKSGFFNVNCPQLIQGKYLNYELLEYLDWFLNLDPIKLDLNNMYDLCDFLHSLTILINKYLIDGICYCLVGLPHPGSSYSYFKDHRYGPDKSDYKTKKLYVDIVNRLYNQGYTSLSDKNKVLSKYNIPK